MAANLSVVLGMVGEDVELGSRPVGSHRRCLSVRCPKPADSASLVEGSSRTRSSRDYLHLLTESDPNFGHFD